MVEKHTVAYVRPHPDPEILMSMLEMGYQALMLPGYVSIATNHNPDGIVEP
jgi:hypothetical protein